MSIHSYKYPSADEAAEACARGMLATLETAAAGNNPATLAIQPELSAPTRQGIPSPESPPNLRLDVLILAPPHQFGK